MARTVVAVRMVDIEVPDEHRDAAVQALRDGGIGDVLSRPNGLTIRVQGREGIPAAVAILAGVWALEYMFATFFLIVPLMTSAVIAADSFAGEKERKTFEALAYTPTSDFELYAGKLLAPWLAAVAVSSIGYVVFVIVATLVGGAIVGRPIALTPRWLLFVLVIAPGVAALAVGALVQVSARVRGFQRLTSWVGSSSCPWWCCSWAS